MLLVQACTANRSTAQVEDIWRQLEDDAKCLFTGGRYEGAVDLFSALQQSLRSEYDRVKAEQPPVFSPRGGRSFSSHMEEFAAGFDPEGRDVVGDDPVAFRREQETRLEEIDARLGKINRWMGRALEVKYGPDIRQQLDRRAQEFAYLFCQRCGQPSLSTADQDHLYFSALQQVCGEYLTVGA